MSLHVLYVINSLAVSGGAEQSLAAMTPHLVQRGVTFDIAYLDPREGLQRRLAEGGARLFPVDATRARAVFGLTRLARSLRPDIMHTTLFEADQAGRVAGLLAGIPSVTSLVNVAYGPDHRGDPSLRAWKVRGAQAVEVVTARAASRFHANSFYVADVMARRLLRPRARIDVIPRGRDPEVLGRRTRHRRQAARAALGVPESVPMVLAAARHEHQKGLDVLVGAAAAILRGAPGAQLVVAGREGNQTLPLRVLVERAGLGDRVRFLGARPDVADLLSAADVFVLPSRWEGLPGVLIEALALETPIVAADIPSVREVVGSGADGVATLFPPDRPEALARAVLGTLADATATDRARRGRAVFDARFTIGRVADQMVEFYERALAVSRAGKPAT